MEMDERKKRILHAVINDYIDTAEPVGSRVLSKREGIDFSAATIRNEMADLEDMGYLEKPHTSSGRVPSSIGYRFYVNSLMQEYRLSVNEIKRMRDAMQLRVSELNELVAEASNIISKLTNYTVIAGMPRPFENTLRSFKLLNIGPGRVIIIVSVSGGIIKNNEISLPQNTPPELIDKFSEEAAKRLVGIAPSDLYDKTKDELERLSAFCPQLWDKIYQILCDWFINDDKKHVYAGGVVNIFNHPEYKDVGKAKEFIGFLDSRDNISRIIGNTDNDGNVKIIIGDENDEGALKNCSIIISSYNFGDTAKGSVGIIGPTRMEYAKIISSLEVITDRLSAIIYKLFF